MEYKGLDHITSKLGWVAEAGLVLDGELVLADKQNMSDNEAFRVATGILNSDSMNKIGICFTIFDALPIYRPIDELSLKEDWDSGLINDNKKETQIFCNLEKALPFKTVETGPEEPARA